jgi:hypothetical protein
MTYETIEPRKTTPIIGAEIFGVDHANGASSAKFRRR